MQNLNFHDFYANAHAIFSHFFPIIMSVKYNRVDYISSIFDVWFSRMFAHWPMLFHWILPSFIATIQGFRHCLVHTFNWITSFEFCKHVTNMLMQALTHMDPNCLKYWAYCWSKLQAISLHQKKNIYQYLILTTGLGFSPATCYPLRYQNVNGVIMPENM